MKTHLTKRLVALFLTLVMVLSLMPMTFAEEAAADEYVLAAEVKNGDKVVIYNADAGKAISNADSDAASNPERYRLGVSVEPADGKLTAPDAQLVWTAEVTADGTAFKDADGKYLSVPATYNNLVLDSDCRYWNVQSAATADSVYLISTTSVGSSGDPRGIEYYQNRFTTYYASESNINNNEAAFAMQLFVLSAGETPEPPAPVSDDVVVLYTNDVHCGVDQTEESIGVAGLAKVKKELEADHGNVVLVDNGDFIQGELIGTVSKGEYLVQLMNYLGYEFAAFGNHEFDYGMEQLKKLVDMSEVEYLSCNFRYIGEAGNADALDPQAYKVVDYDGLKVGFVGAATPESLVKSTPAYFQDENGEWIYSFCNDESGAALYAAVQEAVDAARAEGAQVVVLLAHLGIDEQSSPWMSTEVIANTNGIDVVLDGHSHSTIARQEVQNKDGDTVLLSSTGTKLANVGKLTITKEGAVDTELITRADVDGVDPETQAYLEQIEAEFEELKQQVVAHTDTALVTKDPSTGARMVRMRETNLGDVCADAYRTVLGADIAFVNGGGVRADIPAGDVTYEQIIKVHPYGNMACVVQVTGQVILDALEMGSKDVNMDESGNLYGESGGFLHVSGLKYSIDTTIPSSVVVDDAKLFVEVAGERRVKDVQVLRADGSYAPIDPEATYTLASHNYMLKLSGDGYTMFKNCPILLDEVKVDNQVLIEYMSSEAFAAHDYSNWKGEGRITLLPEPETPEQELAGKTVILHTNDTHGAIMGFAQVAKIKADFEAKGANVILVDAGDFSQGTTYVASSKGAAAVTMLNAAGYDYVTLGNHEFDFGYAQLMQNFENAEFRVLCADVLLKADGTPAFDPYAIEEIDGMKIGFFGMETPETFTKVNPGLIQEITFPQGVEMYAIAQAQVDALRAEGADLVIALTHLGVDDESIPNRSIDLFAHVTGIDFVIDGHSHTVMTEGPNGEPIQSTGTKAGKTSLMNVGMIQIDDETKTIEKHELIPLGENAERDPAVAEIAQQIMDAVDAEYGAKFAESLVELNGDRAPGNRNMETNLGDLITDAMLWSVVKAGGLEVPAENVVAITNGGGIRAWIHKGDVTKNDVNTVLPFGNTVAVVYVSGAELLEALEASTYCTPTAVGGFPQVSGIKYNIDVTKEFDKGEQYPESTYFAPASIRRVMILEINGQPFDPDERYAVVTNDFCSAGGDTYHAFKAASSQFDTGLPMDEVLMDYITEELGGVIGEDYAEPKGRITQGFLFEDVTDSSKFYFEPVYWAYNHDPQITNGTSSTKFSPYKTCTRAEAVTFIWRAFGCPEPVSTENPFQDVSRTSWYYKAVQWAVENGVTTGTDTAHFSPKKGCTRAEIVTFLWRAFGSPSAASQANPFEDVKRTNYFCKAVLWAAEKRVTNGTDATHFTPNKVCTRAEIVTFLYNAFEKPTLLEGKTVILHTNDTHGAIMGFAQVAKLKGDYEAMGANVILADAGDYSQGTTYVSLSKGETAITMLNAAGYDFATLGNHEFDYGWPQLSENLEKAEFTPLVADILFEETGMPILEGHAVKDFDGIKIGFFGMDTPEASTKANPALLRGLVFPQGEEMYAIAQAEVDALKAEGADLVIALTHLGVDDESEPNRSIDLFANVTGIDFIIDGHSHTVMTEGPNGEPIQSTGTKADKTSLMNVGFIQIDNETKTIEKHELIPLNGESARDAAVAEVAQEIIDAVDAEYGAKFAESLVELNGSRKGDANFPVGNRTGETNLGDLITDAMLWSVVRSGGLTVDDAHVVAITNGGGIRDYIHKGDVTKNDVNTVLPFGNTVAVVYVSGAELLEALEASTYCTPGEIGGFPQVAGMKYNIDITREYDKGEKYPGSTYYAPASIQRVSIEEIGGLPFDETAVYAVVTNNFCAAGGDTYYAFSAAENQFDTGLPLDEVLMDYITTELGGVIGEDYAETKDRITQESLTVNTEFEFLVTSDLHGQIFATDYTRPYEQSGTYNRGLTRVASYIKEQKAEYGDNLYVVDMGDTFQGAPLTYYYAFNKPEEKDPAILAFRTIGYDMWVVGNHEFNYGLNILTRQMDYAVSESTETEKQLTISMANYLKAETNNDETKDWATWRDVAPYVIKDFDGYKVAVIGFGNPNIPKWDVPANWEGIYFAPIVETYKHYEAEMLEQADMIVVVAHSGTDSDPGSDFMKQLVEETDTIAFAFSGHEHKNTITRVTNAAGKEIPILSPYTKARRIAQVKVTVDGEDVSIEPELVNMEGYKLDEDLAALLQPYETDTWENYMLQPIGQALGDYPAADLGTAPSAFMDLINTVQAWGAYDNTGLNTPDKAEDDVPPMLSISAPLTSGSNANLISEGPIVLGDMFGLYRFENWFYQINMSGEEVHQWLEFAATKIRIDEEGKPYVTNGDLTYYDVIMGDGFHYDIDVSKPEGERVVNMTWRGAKITPDQNFTVVVNNYRYNGGGNYVSWLNSHGCEFVANDPDRIIYSTQYDMIQGEDEGQARALLVSYIKKETAEHGGITPFITSTWTVQNGIEEPEEHDFETVFPSTSNDDIAKYGNIYTSADGAAFFAEGFTWGDVVTVKFLDQELELPIVPTFSYVESGTPGVFVNKDAESGEPTGRVFMAINMGNFADAYGLATKTTNPDKTYYWTAKDGVEFPVPVTIDMKEAGGYLSEMLLRDIHRTNNREDYPTLTDEEFANFRQVTTTGMGDHFYRGSSPINPEIGRNTYADAALQNAGVTVIMNLADSQTEAEAYPGFADSYYAGQNVIFLNLGVDFTEDSFKTGLAAGLRHFAANEGVYYVHCTEGKDRAGFVSALLECLMGASYDEVVADYLKTYTNYYDVIDGVQQPLSEETLDAIAESNIVKSLCRAFDVETLKTADLAAEAEAYIAELGLSADEIAALKANLGGNT